MGGAKSSMNSRSRPGRRFKDARVWGELPGTPPRTRDIIVLGITKPIFKATLDNA